MPQPLASSRLSAAPDLPRPAPGQVRSIAMADARIDSADLFRDGRLVIIEHGGETYRLRLTAQNRLILTK